MGINYTCTECKSVINPLKVTAAQFRDYSTYISQATQTRISSFCNDPIYKSNTSRLRTSQVDTSEESTSGDYIEVFPNPAKEHVLFKIKMAIGEGLGSLKFFDTMGQEVETIYHSNEQQGKEFTIPYNNQNLSNGLYLCVIETVYGKRVVKLIIQK